MLLYAEGRHCSGEKESRVAEPCPVLTLLLQPVGKVGV